jgi:hypothetical protein
MFYEIIYIDIFYIWSNVNQKVNNDNNLYMDEVIIYMTIT